jgi:hypothetical protein
MTLFSLWMAIKLTKKRFCDKKKDSSSIKSNKFNQVRNEESLANLAEVEK